MSSPEQKKCNQCLQVFSQSKAPLKMLNCKHNLCQQCLQQIRQAKIDTLQCQFCNTAPVKILNKKFEPNKALISKLKQKKQWVDKIEENNNSVNISTKAENESHQCLLSDEDGSAKKYLNKSQRQSIKKNKKQADMCEQHEKPFEIICITDLKMICPHCAIFGNHKEHSFKTLKQFNKDYEQNYEKVQMIKQQKYMYDKKLKTIKYKDNIQSTINEKKTQIRAQIAKLFEKCIKDLQDLQVSICEQLNKQYVTIYNDILAIFEQNKIEEEFVKWQSNCQNYLANVDKATQINQKVKIFYGSQTILGYGQDIVDKLQKKLQMNSKKMQNLVDCIKIQVKEELDINKLIRISKKQQDKKDNFVMMIQKINIPGGKHVLQDNADFNQNSFITDYSKQDFSLILDGQIGKSNGKPVLSKRTPAKPTLASTIKFKSPTKKPFQTQTLIRHKSNTHIKTESQLTHNISDIFLNSSTKLQIRDPSIIVKDFIKHDLKEVLDLSRCQLNDQNVSTYLKQVRKHRKIRGLKLCNNEISDAGFQSMLQYLGSTTNLNLSYNKLTQQTLSSIIKNRDLISPLRIVNFSYNNLNDKKSKTRIDALKKMGIIINI